MEQPVNGDLWEALSPEDVVATLDRLTDGLFVFDLDWHFRYVNASAAEMLGHTREELTGAHAWSLFPEAVGGPSYTAYHQARAEHRPVTTTEHYAPLGRTFEIRVYPVDADLAVIFRDVTELARAEADLREYADRMSEAERIAHFGVWRWDIETGTVTWSDELHALFGLQPGEFAGTAEDFIARLHPDDRVRVWGEVTRALETLEPFTFEERALRPDGSERLLLSQGRVVAGDHGRPVALVGVCHDVTELVRAERALGHSDRRMRAIVDNTPSIIAVKDLDGRYVTANVESGRIAGLAADEIVGRLCTDVFPKEVALQVKANDAIAIAENRAVFDETVLVVEGEPRTFVTVTFPLPDEEGRPAEVCTIGTDVTERRERESQRRTREEWADRIGAALAEDRIVLHAQPVVEISSGAQLSCELLARLRPPGAAAGELEPPASFLPQAERFGLVQEIDTFVVRRALAVAGRTLRLAVNLSAVTLRDPDARDAIVEMLRERPGAAEALVFEITETAELDHLEAAVTFAADISALGCGFALDDFGTGFGSFTYLRALPLRYLKIDRSFVSGAMTSKDDRRVVQSVIGIAGQFGLRTIAEGVEDQATLDLLRSMGADFAQGFHIGRPGPLEL